jgi:uncharacterized protein (DUF488 family)
MDVWTHIMRRILKMKERIAVRKEAKTSCIKIIETWKLQADQEYLETVGKINQSSKFLIDKIKHDSEEIKKLGGSIKHG